MSTQDMAEVAASKDTQKTIKLVFTVPATNRLLYLLNDKRRTHKFLIKELAVMLANYGRAFGNNNVKLEIIDDQ